MAKNKLTLEEQETIFLTNRADADMEIFTYDPAYKRKLFKLAEQFPEIVKIKNSDNGEGGSTFCLPKKLVTIRKPVKRKELSAEQRQVLTERLQGTKSL